MQVNESVSLGLSVAERLASASEMGWIDLYEDLKRRRQLFLAIHQINRLLDDPAHEDVARMALRRIGLEYSG